MRRPLPVTSDRELQATGYSEQARPVLPHRATGAMGRRPPSAPGVMHLTTAAAVRMRAGRTDTRSAPEQPEAARHRPKTSDCRYPISSRLVSSRLISSRQLPHDVTTIRPKSAAVISSFVPTTQECYRHRLLASIPGSRPILVSSVSPHLIVSSLFSALSSHLVQSPGFPTEGSSVGRCTLESSPAPPLSFYETIQGIDHSAAGRSGRTPARRWRPAPSSG